MKITRRRLSRLIKEVIKESGLPRNPRRGAYPGRYGDAHEKQATEKIDSDQDGIYDFADSDLDNDGVVDSESLMDSSLMTPEEQQIKFDSEINKKKPDGKYPEIEELKLKYPAVESIGTEAATQYFKRKFDWL